MPPCSTCSIARTRGRSSWSRDARRPPRARSAPPTRRRGRRRRSTATHLRRAGSPRARGGVGLRPPRSRPGRPRAPRPQEPPRARGGLLGAPEARRGRRPRQLPPGRQRASLSVGRLRREGRALRGLDRRDDARRDRRDLDPARVRGRHRAGGDEPVRRPGTWHRRRARARAAERGRSLADPVHVGDDRATQGACRERTRITTQGPWRT